MYPEQLSEMTKKKKKSNNNLLPHKARKNPHYKVHLQQFNQVNNLSKYIKLNQTIKTGRRVDSFQLENKEIKQLKVAS